MNIDLFIFHLINGLSRKWWLSDWLGIFLAEYLPYLVVLLAIFILLKEKKWRQRFYFFALTSLSVVLARGVFTEIIRFFYYRPRPFWALQIQSLIGNSDTNGSFPSGHATAYFALALAIFYFLQQVQDEQNPKLGWWFLTVALLIGLGRIFVGVHYPSDVLVGALIGLLSAFLVKKILPLPEIKNAPPAQ